MARPLRTLLARDLLLLTGISLALLSGASWAVFARAMSLQAEERTRLSSLRMVESIRTFFTERQSSVESLAFLRLTSVLDPDSPETSHPALASLGLTLQGIRNAGFLEEDLRWMGATPTSRGVQTGLAGHGPVRTDDLRLWDGGGHFIERLPLRTSVQDPRRPWILAARSHPEGIWTAPFLLQNLLPEETNPVGMCFTKEVSTSRGRLLGIATTATTLDLLKRQLQALLPTPGAQFLVDDGEGRAVFLPRLAEPDDPGPEVRSRTPLGSSFLPEAWRVARQPKGDSLWLRSQRYLVARQKVLGVPGVDWTLHLLIPQRDLTGRAWGVARSALFATVLCCLLVGWRVAVLTRRFASPLQRLQADSRVMGQDHPFQHSPSGIQEIEVLATRLREAGEALRERATLESHLRHAQRLEIVGTYASGVGRDILAHLSRAEAALEGAGPAESEEPRPLAQARKALRSASTLAESLTPFSRRHSPLREVVDLNATVEHSAFLVRQVLGKRITLHLNLAPIPPRIHGNPLTLEQVIMNLAINARDAMGDSGTLSIRTGHQGAAQTFLDVSDTGTGMSEEIQAKIFEPFFTTKTEGKGTGLGLAIVRRMVEDLSGRIELRSRLGEGTTFTLLFPSSPDC